MLTGKECHHFVAALTLSSGVKWIIRDSDKNCGASGKICEINEHKVLGGGTERWETPALTLQSVERKSFGNKCH